MRYLTTILVVALWAAGCSSSGESGGPTDSGAPLDADSGEHAAPDPGPTGDPGSPVDPGGGDQGPVDPGTADTPPVDKGTDAQVPAGCCTSDQDCAGEGGTCVKDQGPLTGRRVPYPDLGVCKPIPDAGRCWSDADCAKGWACHSPMVCPCGANCDVMDAPGVCVQPGSQCNPVDPAWVSETCDAASVVVFDGAQCVKTCPGCCGCEPFCDLVFQTIDECMSACAGDPGCTYVAATAQGPFTLSDDGGQGCPGIEPMDGPCASDDDCEGGRICVLGACVDCWEDTACGPAQVCRSGRCVPKLVQCDPAPPCIEPGCLLVTPSEAPCPVCVCDTPFNKQCSDDETCMKISSHKFLHCVWGRCADCRNDSECDAGACVQPGMCTETEPGPWAVTGTWLVGWSAGMNHFSYFRFEPDGTLRRGRYEAGGAWSDDIPKLPCQPDEGVFEYPLVGTWSPEPGDDHTLSIRMTLNLPCADGAGWEAVYLVAVAPDGNGMDLLDSGSSTFLNAIRVDPAVCLPDMSECSKPDM